MKIKTPFNWAGNKLGYMEYVNTLLIGRRYDRVVDMFMGSGNLLLNTRCNSEQFIGNDILRLLPEILGYMSNNILNFKLADVKEIEDEWKFAVSEDYYTFRTYWNERHMSKIVDKKYIIETVMLLKMCNNSLVRFNRKGEFNQGFRGISKSKADTIQRFFTRSAINGLHTELNALNNVLMARRFKFYNKDFKDLVEELELDDPKGKDLIIMDPPYILTNTSVYGGTYTNEKEEYLLNFIDNLKSDFILFNYISNCEVEHTGLTELVEKNNYKVITLSTRGKLKTIAGQNTIQEVLITNI